MVRVYTKTGDQGDTALFDGKRVPKDHARVAAYGAVDELNSYLSLCRTTTSHAAVADALRDIQRFLFVLGADLSTPPGEGKASQSVRRVTPSDVGVLESLIDNYWPQVEKLDTFVVPGETTSGAHFHVARTICRRAERATVTLATQSDVGAPAIQYLNRLSDLLFTLGRFEDEATTGPDPIKGLRDQDAP